MYVFYYSIIMFYFDLNLTISLLTCAPYFLN